jgi:small neutral amino acid transporter SnatA (MarC family)
MLLSWRLWRAIFHNRLYDFPLIERELSGVDLLAQHSRSSRRRQRLRHIVIIATIVAIFLLYPSAILGTLGIIFVAFVILAGTTSGWAAGTRIASLIYREKSKRRYDLLLLTPPGVLGVHWALVTRTMRDQPVLRWMRWVPAGFYLMVGFPVLGLLITAGLTSIFWFFGDQRSILLNNMLQLVWLLTVMALLYSDYVQSVVLGVLIGILIPTYAEAEESTGAFALASAGFFGGQTLYYFFFILVGGLLFYYGIVPMIGAGHYLGLLIATLVYGAAMILCREWLARRLWRVAEDRLNFSAIDSGLRA